MEGSERWRLLIDVFKTLVFVSWKQLEQRLLKTAKEKMEQLSRALSESEWKVFYPSTWEQDGENVKSVIWMNKCCKTPLCSPNYQEIVARDSEGV